MANDVMITERELLDPVQRPADENPTAVYLAGLRSPHSRRNLRRYLDQVAGLLSGGVLDALMLDWSRLRFQHVAALRARLSETYAPATVNGMLSAVRGVLKTAWKLGQMTSEDYHRAVDVANVKGQRLPAGRDLNFREIRALLAACGADEIEPPRKGQRDAAIIALLYATGMRRAEIANLALADYDANTGRVRILSGKGDKDRVVYVKNRPRRLLDAWLTVRGDLPGPLFYPVNKGDNVIVGQGITAQAVYNMLKTRAADAGVDDFSPHDIRRTFVGDALDAGVDLATVAEIAGHASTDTTRRYDRRGDRAKEQAANKLDL